MCRLYLHFSFSVRFLPSFTFFLIVTPGDFIFLFSFKDRRPLSACWAEIFNFNDDSSEDWCCVVSCTFSVLKTRGAQVPGARSHWRLNFVQWHLMF